jgi:hypothetical protein
MPIGILAVHLWSREAQVCFLFNSFLSCPSTAVIIFFNHPALFLLCPSSPYCVSVPLYSYEVFFQGTILGVYFLILRIQNKWVFGQLASRAILHRAHQQDEETQRGTDMKESRGEALLWRAY